MRFMDKAFGDLKTKRFWHRRYERLISMIITGLALPMLGFYMLGSFAGIAIERLNKWEHVTIQRIIKKEKAVPK